MTKSKTRLELTGKAADDFFRAVVAQQNQPAPEVKEGVVVPQELAQYLWGLIEIERYRLHQDWLNIITANELDEGCTAYIKEQLLNLNALRLCFGGAE